jgi:hypothetical protein
MLEKSPGEWARLCRVEAAWATDSQTKALLLEMAAEYEALVSDALKPPPDLPEPISL